MKRSELRIPIGDVMTASPHSIGREQTLATALALMRRYDIRHLPVLDGGRIAGLLSQRDVLFVETLRDVDPSQVAVEEAMSTDVYTVAPETPLVEVVADMADHKYGCVVVVEGARIAGIFTTVDALRVLVTALRAAERGPAPPARTA
ncbi:MAG TPA: CBS domain-containing protein [Polyangiaceae bacterium]|nr:CBS domain-containing protein [Polyangiaceae bacterium]